jgi:Uma2 family endonuclease
MSTTTIEVLVPPPGLEDPADPFRYGWRVVRHDTGDGNITVEQVPLTLEDVLHPEEGDQVTHSDAHQRRRRYLCNIFESRLAHEPRAVVLDDVRVKWDLPELKPHGPDIMVVLGVRERKNWSTFDVAQEGVRPALIVEITSPETRALDLSVKLDEYDLAGVPLYVIVDAVQRQGREVLRLLGYQQTATAYEVLPPDEQGRLYLEPLRLHLGIHEGELVCYDEAGVALGDYTAVDAARAAAEARAAEAEARLRAAEAELARLRGERARE